MKSNRFWVIVLGGLLVLSVVSAFLLARVPAGYASIYKDGELIDTVNLLSVSQPLTIVVEGTADLSGAEAVNIIEAEYGRIRMLEANCPDGSCVRLGWASGGVIPIVCLPNRVIITLSGSNNEHDIDAVVG